MKKIFVIFFLILCLTGCSASNRNGGNYPPIKANTLTASAYSDQDNYDYWLSLIEEDFKMYKPYDINTKHRIKVSTASNVLITPNDGIPGVTNANGEVYLFMNEKKDTYLATITYTNTKNELVEMEYEIFDNINIQITDCLEKDNKIEVMFIIDTTASMKDELKFLQAELEDVINRLVEATNAQVFVSLLFYRDKKDEYIVRFFDFTDDLNYQIDKLNSQAAFGGGDYEEAIDAAYNQAVQANWCQNGTRIAVHIADAPVHSSGVHKMFRDVSTMSGLGIRIISVASSGSSDFAEYLFRSQSLITNGIYTLLTDDSGVGEKHKTPRIEEELCVEYLNDMLVRLIQGFHTGTFNEPVEIRSEKNDSK